MVPLHSGVAVKEKAPGNGDEQVTFRFDFKELKYDSAKVSRQDELVNLVASAESTNPISFKHPVAAEYFKTPR